jgi:hypothetical protein
MPRADAAARIRELDWSGIAQALDASGYAPVQALLTSDECDALAALYPQDSLFRSRVIMSRHGFGSGEYKYFDYPLPTTVATIREVAYAHLVTIANQWHTRLAIAQRFPPKHSDYLRRCHAAGQHRPTPLMLSYGAGDYNCLHQDLYGEHVFPIQLTALLSDPRRDFAGGEFVLTEQRPRMQSRAHVIQLGKGDGVLFAVNFRPAEGSRGYHRVRVRHGVSTIRSGNRHTLGVIFHDARCQCPGIWPTQPLRKRSQS